jgi:hypothetical protein
MLRSTLTFALALSLAACQSIPAVTPDPEPVLLEAFDLDAYSPFGVPIVTGPTLETGEPYRITVQGTYSVWDFSNSALELCKGAYEALPMFESPGRSNGAVSLDAHYQFAMFASDPACETETDVPLDFDVFRVSLDGGATFASLVPEGTPGIDSEHRYTYEVTGEGEAVRFQIADQIAGDNYGVLKIEVFAFE